MSSILSDKLPWSKRPENILKLRAYQKEYYQNNKEACDARTYRNRTPERELYYKAKGRAKKNGLDFNIDLEDIVIPDKCPILGIPIRKAKGKMDAYSPTLDRRVNNKGYVKGNVSVISNKANMCKSDMSPEQIEALYKYVFELEREQ